MQRHWQLCNYCQARNGVIRDIRDLQICLLSQSARCGAMCGQGCLGMLTWLVRLAADAVALPSAGGGLIAHRTIHLVTLCRSTAQWKPSYMVAATETLPYHRSCSWQSLCCACCQLTEFATNKQSCALQVLQAAHDASCQCSYVQGMHIIASLYTGINLITQCDALPARLCPLLTV
jgi:hypothetical protein